MKAAINEGKDELAEDAEFSETSGTLTMTSTISATHPFNNYYDLNALMGTAGTFLRAKRVFNTTTNRWLQPSDMRELDGMRRQWEDATGAPERWWMRGQWWIGLYPYTTSGTMTVYYNTTPADLSGNSDTLSIPEEYHLAVVEYACYELLFQEREHRLKAPKFYARYNRKGDLIGGYRWYAEQLARWVRARDRFDRITGYA